MTRWILLIFPGLLLPGCTATESYTSEYPLCRLPEYDWPARCPAGHEQIRRVPILYGYVSLTPEGQRLKEAGEIILGGCLFSDRHDAHARGICAECEYTFNPVEREWDRYSRDPASFGEPFSPSIMAFPIPSIPQENAPHYGRVVVDGRTKSERLSYDTTEREDAVMRRVEQYFSSLGLAPERTVSTPSIPLWERPSRRGAAKDERVLTAYAAESHDGRLGVEVLAERRIGTILVSVTFEPWQ